MLHFQDFNFGDTFSLHEALINISSESISGSGAYAFVSKSGVDILLKDNAFLNLLDRGKFQLIIGIDEITNSKSLESLNEIKSIRNNFEVKAFYHNNKNSLFHPKFSYFKKENGSGNLILGSGNLTVGGLRKNREAFVNLELDSDEINRIELYWQNWIENSANNLKDINDPLVLEKAMLNNYISRQIHKIRKEEPIIPTFIQSQPEEIVVEGWNFDSMSEVLIVEIPRSGNRWKQVNFDLDNFTNFFGATPGNNSQRVLLRNINEDLSLSEIEIRQSVSVVSQNYRFELNAASGIDYPTNGRPIGVFIKVTTRMFLYHIFMPENTYYNEILEWLNSNWQGREDRMKRLRTRVNEIPGIINNTMFAQFLVD